MDSFLSRCVWSVSLIIQEARLGPQQMEERRESFLQNRCKEFPSQLSALRTRLVPVRMQGQPLGSLSELRRGHCCGQRRRWETWFGGFPESLRFSLLVYPTGMSSPALPAW